MRSEKMVTLGQVETQKTDPATELRRLRRLAAAPGMASNEPTLAGSWDGDGFADIYSSLTKPMIPNISELLRRIDGKKILHLRFDHFLSMVRIHGPIKEKCLGCFPLDGTTHCFPHPCYPGIFSTRCILRSCSHVAFEMTFPVGFGKARWDIRLEADRQHALAEIQLLGRDCVFAESPMVIRLHRVAKMDRGKLPDTMKLPHQHSELAIIAEEKDSRGICSRCLSHMSVTQ